jgi:hypothetical protein
MAASTVSLLEREAVGGEPAPALDAEQIAERGAADQLTHLHRMDLVLDARARTERFGPTAARILSS